MTKRESVSIHLELVPAREGAAWGWTYAMEGSGGCGDQCRDQLHALLKAYREARKELRRIIETREEKASRLQKRKDAIKRAKDKGLLS